jgi:hypothetical protein
MVQSGTPVSTSAGPGTTVNSGSFTVINTSGTTLIAPTVTISFDNADVFSSATLTGAVGPVFSAATVNPVDGGNSPEQPNSTSFALEPPLVVPTGQTATFSLSVTVSNNPQQTRQDQPIKYAGVIGGAANGSGALLIGLALLELCATGMSSSRRRRLLMAGILLFFLASQVGCDNGSTGGGAGATSGIVQSTQTAMQVAAMKRANNNPVAVGGLPVEMGTVAIK